MPQPKWYHKSLSELCMDSIVDNMEKWTALRSSEHVSSLFYLLREYEIVGYCYGPYCYYCYFIMLFGLHTAYHCLKYVTENYELTEDMFDLLLNPHTKVLDLLDSDVLPDFSLERNLRICGLASVRCSVIINSAIL